MKVIFSNESKICIGQSDVAKMFLWCHANKIYNDDFQINTKMFAESSML